MSTMAKIYFNDSGLRHDTGPGHPECPDRLRVIHELFTQEPFSSLPVTDPRAATYGEIFRVHPENYVHRLESGIPDEGIAYLDGDTVISPASWVAALEAAGAVCQAVDDIAAGAAKRAFCAVRPPGHHAEPEQAMGFCLFNNIAIGARHAQDAHRMKKIAIVDFDVHHGNGTDTVARSHESLFYASTHQWPLFPGTGLPQENIPGRVVNITLSSGAGSAAFRDAYTNHILPALDKFAPDLLMISAGFDAHRDDPLAGITLDEDDFTWITDELVKIAEKHCQGKIVSVLEGGYNLDALKNSVGAHLKALAGL